MPSEQFLAGLFIGMSFACIVIIWTQRPKTPKILCKHDWELKDTQMKFINGDVDHYNIKQCKNCLEIRHELKI